VKFVRVPGYSDPIERDERALAAVAGAGGVTAAHAPRFLGRLDVSGLAASIETAAAGRRLSAILTAAGSRAAKMRAVDAVAKWIVRVGLETRHDGAAGEVERLRKEVLASWPVASEELLSDLGGLPAVLQHNDLGTWNIVSDGGADFTAVDWESANPSGLPLWDLWYFLADALRLLDGGEAADSGAFARLFRGEAPASPELFRWTRIAVEALAIPAQVVGKLATLCWLHHGLSHEARSAALDRAARGGETMKTAATSYPHVWLSDPALGSGWRSWVEGGGAP
jgi:Ser/Thr protein kinase RdoA (MazF antagonist)